MRKLKNEPWGSSEASGGWQNLPPKWVGGSTPYRFGTPDVAIAGAMTVQSANHFGGSTMNRTLSVVLLLVPVLTVPGLAEVIDSSAHGFTSRNTAKISAPPHEVYARLIHTVNLWWSPHHTYSGNATNLRIEARQGGCFCEDLPNGGVVEHLTVVYADPGKALRLTGGLGPLQATGATGAMTWELTESDAGTTVDVTYAVGGYVDGGIDAWATGVDHVVREQLERLARYIDTGTPEEQVSGNPATDGGS
jgi:hypothetical protein